MVEDKAKAERTARRFVTYIYAAKYAAHCDTLDMIAHRAMSDPDMEGPLRDVVQDCIDARWRFLHPTLVKNT